MIAASLFILSSCGAGKTTGRVDPAATGDLKGLDERVPPAGPGAYGSVLEWPNPVIICLPEGVELRSQSGSITHRASSPEGLEKALIELPVAAWPYGRVVRAHTPGLRGGAPGTEAWLRDDELIARHKAMAEGVLRSMGVELIWGASG